MPSERFDYVVVGSGLAGLSFALAAAESGTVCVLTKSAIAESNTNYAQGGIAAAIGESDDVVLHEADTLAAGAGLCDPKAVKKLVQEAPRAIEWLRELGARFDSGLAREGGHSRNRIVHHGDRTGWEVERAVCENVRREPRITVFENTLATSLLLAGGRVAGVRAMVHERGEMDFTGRAVLLATGGCGRVYAHTTNPRVATGDGIGLALAAGAEVRDMEFMQFHPTTLNHPQLRNFLVTEAVRGAGATLRDYRGRRFMYDYHGDLELAPRDVVARAIEAEMARLDSWCVYLDAAHLDATQLEEKFPTVWSQLRSVGIEMEKEWIPVVPAQHYSCGGIVTDLTARSTVPGLFAAGEVARTGVHGANRLASNSLLEAIVFAREAAFQVEGEPEPAGEVRPAAEVKRIIEGAAVGIRSQIQRSMSQFAGVFRTNEGLSQLTTRLEEAEEAWNESPTAGFSGYVAETHNLLRVAQCVCEGAVARKENVGLHFNADLATTPASRATQEPASPTDPSST